MTEDEIVALIKTLGPTVGALAVALPGWIKERRTRQRLDDPAIVARGLAIGYFQNFLGPVGSQLNQAGLVIDFGDGFREIPSITSRRQVFYKSDVDVVLIVPETLSANAINRSIDSQPQRQAEVITANADDRGRKVKYELTERLGKTVLVIKDLVRPCFALKYYAEDQLGLEPDSDQWRRFATAALAEFKRTIDEQLKKGAGTGIRNLAWKDS
jgi:hypothetical protein